MKQVKAFIKNKKLQDVISSLQKIEGLSGGSVTAIYGFGRDRDDETIKESWDNKESLDKTVSGIYQSIPHKRIEIVCRDELVEVVLEAIQKSAHTGLRGDGIIYVCPVEDAVRISTAERGECVV